MKRSKGKRGFETLRLPEGARDILVEMLFSLHSKTLEEEMSSAEIPFWRPRHPFSCVIRVVFPEPFFPGDDISRPDSMNASNPRRQGA